MKYYTNLSNDEYMFLCNKKANFFDYCKTYLFLNIVENGVRHSVKYPAYLKYDRNKNHYYYKGKEITNIVNNKFWRKHCKLLAFT